ncbi:hypothetical protein EUX48_02860 [Haemophilus haemolyticus]|uniref:DNA helicase UvrD n=1 Tax=Haemophilus haemolyticus TaxID=726 RepID=A0A502LR29_HAEHA|nr:hypothetical protein [Haemophilus haemolyticus]TPH24535.1 hypothetical protein EUX48_02860 [Haemophilus haemolyticus]
MAKVNKFKRWGYHVLISIDQLFNALIGGAADETLSSRTYRQAVLKEKPLKRWRVLLHLINGLFFDRNHCKEAYFSEVYRRQYTEDFQQETAK